VAQHDFDKFVVKLFLHMHFGHYWRHLAILPMGLHGGTNLTKNLV